ncbi:MAG TPA: NADP-dependent oxidoreductase [Phenylobacterium sp.]|jgi:NADPH:quinone reductase-like Zn-dependent oxidoreductase|uniref:NADP-dependent oxidoreductase n=1 Tax=Phenylobacterium sp. TaxID=1871053 RepID=UPI002D6B7789|nr:NADP-dependent oxidoreductase [Phenylobacterium sp.]HZZ70224.1 NADP-dependent oxidoreductase [Phenylobacterium sp.]
MKAVRIHAFGGPDVIKLEDLPTPEPAANQVLIEVHASSVNPVDYKIRNGGYLAADRLPLTLGRDIAGVVSRCGSQATALRPGDAVYAMLPREQGAFAEFVAVAADVCARKPRRLDFVQAAAVPLAALTAWQGLFDQGHLQRGQSALIHGAAGGVGHFAVQFAVACGATVIATCSREDRDFVRGLGATTVVDYRAGDFRNAAHAVDLVFDLVGGRTQDQSWAVLRQGGVMVSTLGAPDPKKAACHGVAARGYVAEPNGAQLAEIARLIDAGEVTPHVDEVFPLARSADAERHLEQDHVRGKLVLQMA